MQSGAPSSSYKKQVHKIMESREPASSGLGLGLDDLNDQKSDSFEAPSEGWPRVAQGLQLAVSHASGFGVVGTGGRLSLFRVVRVSGSI